MQEKHMGDFVFPSSSFYLFVNFLKINLDDKIHRAK